MASFVGFGNLFRDARKTAGLTQQEVAAHLTISQRMISAWETGKKPIQEQYIAPLCTFLRVPREDLAILHSPHSVASSSQPMQEQSQTAITPPRWRKSPPPTFIGREDEIVRICAALHTGSRQVAIHGMGGTGKTTLMDICAARLAPAFIGGVPILAGNSYSAKADMALVIRDLLNQWNVRISSEVWQAIRSSETTLHVAAVELRRALGDVNEVLVVCDNVASPLIARLISELCAELGWALLLTSRERYSLPYCDERILIGPLNDQESIALFAALWRGWGNGWSAVIDETATQTCVQALGYLPLAIRLAVGYAHLHGYTSNSLAHELQTLPRLSRLVDAFDRQQSLDAILERSLKRLKPHERLSFEALSVFGMTEVPLECAQRFIMLLHADLFPHKDIAETTLTTLLAASLLTLVTTAPSEEALIAVHPLLHELAASRFMGASRLSKHTRSKREDVIEQSVVSALHIVVTYIQAADAKQERISIIRSGTMVEHIVKQAGEVAQNTQALFNAVFDLGPILDRHGAWHTILKLWHVVEARLAGETVTKLYKAHSAEVAEAIGYFSYRLGMISEARDWYQTAIDRAVAQGDSARELSILLGLGEINQLINQFETAYGAFMRVLRRAQEVGDSLIEGRAWVCLGDIAPYLNDFTGAEQLYYQGLASYQKAPPEQQVLALFHRGYGLMQLGHHARRQGDFPRAHRYYQEALAIAADQQNQMRIAYALRALGYLILDEEGDLEEAREYFVKSRDMTEALQQPASLADVLRGLAIVALSTEHYAEAQTLLDESLRLSQRVPHPSGIAHTYTLLGQMQTMLQEYRAAEESLQRGMAIAQEIQAWESIAEIHVMWGCLREIQCEFQEAQQHYSQAATNYARLDHHRAIHAQKQSERCLALARNGRDG